MNAVNSNRPDRWKADIAQSLYMSTDWFLRFAPDAYRTTRVQTTCDVEATLEATANLTDIGVALLRSNPGVLPTLRMATCPPLAVDRLIGLAGVPSNLVKVMGKEVVSQFETAGHPAGRWMARGRGLRGRDRWPSPKTHFWRSKIAVIISANVPDGAWG